MAKRLSKISIAGIPQEVADELDELFGDVFGDVEDDEEEEVRVDYEIKEVISSRKNSISIAPQFDEYKMYETLDGELFRVQTQAKKYNSALIRKMDFEHFFAESKNNLKSGGESLASSIAGELNPLTDYFWVMPQTEEELSALKFFIMHQYTITQRTYNEGTADMELGKWIFLVVYDLSGKIRFRTTNQDTIKQQISELMGFLPSEITSKAKSVTVVDDKTSFEKEAQKGFDKIDLS
jgi:hypothetical protein